MDIVSYLDFSDTYHFLPVWSSGLEILTFQDFPAFFLFVLFAGKVCQKRCIRQTE